jgi:protein phosphatase
MQIRPDIELGNLTDVGCEREANEDYYIYFEPDGDRDFDSKGRLLVVADGMGGHNGGQTASRLATDCVRDTFLQSCGDPHTTLVEAFSRAQQAILQQAAADPDLDGMGTTCTAAILRRGQLDYGHIGDSRLYLLRDGSLSQLTEDHSYVHQLVKSGVLTPEEAQDHEQRNVLTAALGMRSSTVAADFSPSPIPLQAGDIVLLCSDGLHGLVSSSELLQIAGQQPPSDACKSLVSLTRQRGAPDNITVQILRVVSAQSAAVGEAS